MLPAVGVNCTTNRPARTVDVVGGDRSWFRCLEQQDSQRCIRTTPRRPNQIGLWHWGAESCEIQSRCSISHSSSKRVVANRGVEVSSTTLCDESEVVDSSGISALRIRLHPRLGTTAIAPSNHLVEFRGSEARSAGRHKRRNAKRRESHSSLHSGTPAAAIPLNAAPEGGCPQVRAAQLTCGQNHSYECEVGKVLASSGIRNGIQTANQARPASGR